ncbi:MAG: tRNA lysidine(34) synthetase TilS [Henriciella sp.]
MSWPELDALIGAYSPDNKNPIAIAVSGGGDSTALMYRAGDWARLSGRALIILTIDHRLRTRAADEAKTVAKWAQGLGLKHQTLAWEAPRLGQAQARKARHTLLAKAARAAGADVLLLGHTFDDVIETVLMRRRHEAPRASLAGPSSASPSPIWPEGRGLTLIRPLLNERRSDLRHWLKAKGHRWFDDPSNENPDFERVRVRQFLRRHPKLSRTMDKVTKELMETRCLEDKCLGDALLAAHHVTTDTAGLITFTPDKLSGNTAARCASVLLRIAGGHDRTPRAGQVRTLLSELQQPGQRQTLAGAWVQKTKTGYMIGRAPGDIKEAEMSDLWDGRYERDETANLPQTQSLLLREALPLGTGWRPIIQDRIRHEAKAYQTLRVMPVHK